MNEIYELKSEVIALCKRYENGDFNLQELQSRLSSIITSEPDIHNIGELLFEVDNDLEVIIFTELESSHRQYGLDIVYDFLKKIDEIGKTN